MAKGLPSGIITRRFKTGAIVVKRNAYVRKSARQDELLVQMLHPTPLGVGKLSLQSFYLKFHRPQLTLAGVDVGRR